MSLSLAAAFTIRAGDHVSLNPGYVAWLSMKATSVTCKSLIRRVNRGIPPGAGTPMEKTHTFRIIALAPHLRNIFTKGLSAFVELLLSTAVVAQSPGQ
jgi:hypothetical protein